MALTLHRCQSVGRFGEEMANAFKTRLECANDNFSIKNIILLIQARTKALMSTASF